jgi:hypothetical protein
MNLKYILQIFENGELKKELEYKTLRDIETVLRIEYHQVRQLYLLNKKQNKRAHPFLLEISKIYKIIDNPNLVCIPVINFD